MKIFNWRKLLPAAGTTVFFLVLPSALHAKSAELPHHGITVSLNPEKHHLSATDTINLPKNFPREFSFALHKGLDPVSPDPSVRVSRKSGAEGAVPLEIFTVQLPPGRNAFTIRYAGNIFHSVSRGMSQARGIDQTPGIISEEGVYLDASSAWYPLLDTDFVSFSLDIDLPAKWDAVSQGERTLHEKKENRVRTGWNSPEPMSEIYLIASRFLSYEKKADNITANVFLRKPDEGLAQKYLDATVRYIRMYEKLIGPYPYGKFALVENFWETGFGMPSFTLLGPTVLRLPFIINTSYPHEILHNWWGNSVYPLYEKGNWSEGLTAYLADHLLKEQEGKGAEYRLNTLQKYADYVSGGKDFALTQFTSRHSPSSEAVGYGKSLMFFHMLRTEMGDNAFIAGMKNFYAKYKFNYAAFPDIRKSFEAVTSIDLGPRFEQWVTRAGAPKLVLEDPKSKKRTGDYLVTARLRQVQPGKPYRLLVPVAVTMEGADKALQTIIEMNVSRQDFSISVPSRPLRIDVDPEFDLFRRLDRGEIPPAITQALGSNKMLVLLPSMAGKKMLAAYRDFANSLAASGPDEVETKLDSEVKDLPKDRAVAILGWENLLFARALPGLKKHGVSVSQTGFRIGQKETGKDNHSVVLSVENPADKQTALLFAAAGGPEALPGLARKLPHYHKYSYLVFKGDEPTNTDKGRWQVLDSPLTAFLRKDNEKASRTAMGTLADREPLAALPRVFSEERMMETVRYLSSNALKGRRTGTPEIDIAADFIAKKFEEAGLTPGGDRGSFYQEWKDTAGNRTMKNVIGIIPGKKMEFSGQSVVLGAHYDHIGTGVTGGHSEDKGNIHPGADDNASGVAVLIELAGTLKSTLSPDRSIVFIAFTGEEEGKLGSSYYVKNEKRFPCSQITGMINIDTVGRFNKGKLLVLGVGSAVEWAHIFRGAGFMTKVEIDTVSEGFDSGDHKSFQQEGVPAVQLFSGPHPDHHRPTDTCEKIDAAGLVKTASVIQEAVEYLAGRDTALTATLKPAEPGPGPSAERKVSLGTIPDFSYNGKGCKISGVVDGSPAAKAGLSEGDIIVRIDRLPILCLKDFSDALKNLQPGDRVGITLLRDGMERTVETTVVAK